MRQAPIIVGLKAGFQGDADHVRGGRYVQSFHHECAMHFDGALRYAEFMCDLFVEQALRGMLEHLTLTFRQALHGLDRVHPPDR